MSLEQVGDYLDTPLWVVIPAAGSGQRMAASLPKQYMHLAGQAVLQRTVCGMLEIPGVAGIVVVLAEGDSLWQTLPVSTNARVHHCIGGPTRALSVVSGLQYIGRQVPDNTWVMVHDAARPLVASSDIERLLKAVYNSGSVGGILATPVSDTLKKCDEYYAVEQTVERDDLWQAQTPQLFRCADLLSALSSALGVLEQSTEAQQLPLDKLVQVVTDEASAMEMAGHAPLLVEALEPNFKITRPSDLRLAEALIALTGGSA